MEQKEYVGLTKEEVAQRTAQGLSNKADLKAGRTEGQIVAAHLFTFFNCIFVVLAVILALVQSSVKNMTFLGVVVCNCAIGIFQEIRAKRAVDKLSLVAAQQVMALRDGIFAPVRSDLLVLGDLVEFTAGDQICADARVEDGEVFVNEALLTGEQDPVEKKKGDTLLSGSFVLSGVCRAELTEVGNNSFASKLAAEAKKDPRAGKSEMMAALDKLVHILGYSLIPIGALTFANQFWRLSLPMQASTETTVAALVGMIPEGLYLLTSVALAASALVLSRKRVLVQDMNCIETLARVDVLCVDKTGTITQPEMQVKELVLLNDTPKDLVVRALGALYGRGKPDNDTAQAMAKAYGQDPGWECREYIPFASQTKWCGGIYEKGSFVVGAPECVLKSRYALVEAEANAFLEKGQRVLLLARYNGDLQKDFEEENVVPMALVVLHNPVRPQAMETFSYFAKQGVCIKVISGDNPKTVSAVAQMAGIQGAERYIDGRELKEEDYEKAVETYTVFGRVTPAQKKGLILALKKQGHTVAMTGDGVNDVLAMKQADCGVAMLSGAQACNQVAQLVLLDSDFGAMPAIVAEGRRVINNIQRAASLFLVKNIMSICVALLSVATGFAYPFLPIQLTLMSTLTIGVPGFFFAMEPNYARVKGKFLPTVLGRALPGGLCNVLAVFILQWVLAAKGLPTGDIRTLCTVVLVTTGILVLVQTGAPLDLFRGIVTGAMALAIAGCFLLLPSLFALHFSGLAALTWLPLVVVGTAILFFFIRIVCKKAKIC